MPGLWAFEAQLPFQKYQRPSIVFRCQLGIQILFFPGDGQEQKDEKVDDDEGRRNPQYIPKREYFTNMMAE